MKILSSVQIRNLDAHTIYAEPIHSVDLMERAAQAFVKWFCANYDSFNPISIFCGQGNNGGDGLAVARLLRNKGYLPSVYVVHHTDTPSEDFLVNEGRLNPLIPVQYIRSPDELPHIPKNTVLIDALLGSGLTRPASGLIKETIALANASGATIISVDIASGLYVDRPNSSQDVIIRPKATISFELPKLAFMFPENESYVGKWEVVPIGLDKSFIQNEPTSFFYTDPTSEVIQPRIRQKFSHKGTYGHALLIAGSYGKIGAALLAAKACLRAGTGLVSVHVPLCGYTVLQSALPEVMVSTDIHSKIITTTPRLSAYQTIGIGPGIGQSFQTYLALKKLLGTASTPLVLDADALNILSSHPELLKKIPIHSILTPHPKEFQRLAGDSENSYDRLEKARTFAAKYQVIICLKGAHTAVILPDGTVHFNSTGNAGMATAGSGDVLTGIIVGLLAQNYSPQDAARVGVFLHGKAGDTALLRRKGSHLIASDIIENI